MNASDSQPEPEIADLAQLLPVPADRDLPADRHLLLREHLMAQIHVASPGFGVVRWPRVGRGMLALAAGVVVLAITVTATTLGTLARTGGQINPTGPGVSSTGPAAFLNRIAAAAARERALRPGPNQFEYVAVKLFIPPVKPMETHSWTPVSDLCKSGGVKPAPGVHCPDRGTYFDPTYRLLSSLPTQPGPLLAWLKAAIGKRPDLNFQVMRNLDIWVVQNITPPKLTAAVYQIMAGMPGLRLDLHAVDELGNPGIGVSFPVNASTRFEWIFNPKTLRLLGTKTTMLRPNGKTFRQGLEVQAKTFVDHYGQVPKQH
jgi:hypothetical protein